MICPPKTLDHLDHKNEEANNDNDNDNRVEIKMYQQKKPM